MEAVARLMGGLFGKPSQLKARLARYPLYVTPYPGEGRKLTLDQARANLAHLNAERPTRLKVFGELLAAFGLDLQAGLSAKDPAPFLRELLDWTARDWPAIHRRALAERSAWLDGPHGGSPEYSLVMDLGVALGEMLIVRHPEYAWRLDLNPANKVMETWRRPCVMQFEKSERVYDFEGVTFGIYRDCVSPTYLVGNGFVHWMLDAIARPDGALL